MTKQKIWDSIDEHSQMLEKMARDIWENPEVSLEEVYASKVQATALEEEGFNVTLGLKDLPTGIMAEYGQGTPVIGILGEYDALETLSQDSVPERKIRVEGGHGHGCGHNLIGVGAIGAVLAIKEAIERGELQGTIRYYGCPAEEELLGKLFMLRDGYFNNCDVLLYWHPSSNNIPWRAPCLAVTSAVFSFKGLTAHAPQAHIGRSALDAVELMNVGANYLREHIPRDVMFHYSILGNGIAPNTVADRCQSWYMMRAPKRVMLDEVFPRLVDVAKGAAMMTGTTLENVEILGGGNEVICNQTLADLLEKNMKELGGPAFTEEDYVFAKKITDQFSPEQKTMGARVFQIPPEYYDKDLMDKVVSKPSDEILPFSGDCDPSWVFPFGSTFCATWPVGVFTHTWQATACTGSGIGFHGMLFASKTLAGGCYELMTDSDLMKKVKDEFQETSKTLHYKVNIGADAVPKKVKLS
ncbi:MAG: amidohydrolase [Sedimentibacter sp.]|uniref:amidohydrolase n=1 Tax=Sedimentibacter sp. TaxID=1960295 RepID=UPI0031590252